MVSRSDKIVLIEGPNLNLIEKRKKIYQSKEPLKNIIKKISKRVSIEYFQFNGEGDIIDKIHEIIDDDNVIGLIINPGAYSHYSIAIKDALEIFNKPKVEVHLTKLFKRSDERKNFVTAKNVDLFISGSGNYGYYLAVDYILYVNQEI